MRRVHTIDRSIDSETDSGITETPVLTVAATVIKPVARAVPAARERRRAIKDEDQIALRVGLTVRQQEALATLEQFRWTLRFVRRPMFSAPIPIVFSPDGGRFVVLEEDGAINENPGFKIRP